MSPKKKSPIEPRTYNVLFVALATKYYEQMLAINGAVQLNHMIQDRARWHTEMAFGLISDTIREGLIWVDKSNCRALKVRQDVFDWWVEKYRRHVFDMRCYVVSARWPLNKVGRKLTLDEKSVLEKNIQKGRLYDLLGARK